MGHKTRLHFPQPEEKKKKTHPPLLPLSPSLSKHKTSVGSLYHMEARVGERRCAQADTHTHTHTFRQGGLTSDMGEITSTHTHHKKTHRLVVSNVMSLSEYCSVILVVSVL